MKIGKKGISVFFYHFLRKFLIRDHETWFPGILWVLACVCEKCRLWATLNGSFLAPNMTKIGHYIGFRLFSLELLLEVCKR